MNYFIWNKPPKNYIIVSYLDYSRVYKKYRFMFKKKKRLFILKLIASADAKHNIGYVIYRNRYVKRVNLPRE